MCGRYTLNVPRKLVMGLFGPIDLPDVDAYFARFNVAPGQKCLVFDEADGSRRAAERKWGLLPRFMADAKGFKPINARAETVATNGMFKGAFARRRCLVPATGFYEPEEDASDEKTGRWWYFKREDDAPFAFAGIWETWGEGEGYLETFTIITTDPMQVVSECGHKRSPVIVPAETYDLWLDGDAKVPQLKKLLAPHPSDEFVGYPVDGRAKSVKAQGPGLIEPPKE